MERVNILCAYGDITGYSLWTREKSHSSEYQATVMLDYYRTLKKAFPRNLFYLKIIGDGFLVIKEIDHSENLSNQIIDFSNTLVQTSHVILKLLKNSHPPTPIGFRSRWGMDYVEKFSNGDFSKYDYDWPEYAGEILNQTDEMLYVKPNELCACTKMVAAIIAQNKNFELKRLSKQYYAVDLC